MKSNYISKDYWTDKPSVLGEVFVLAGKYDDVINLSIGDPDLPCDKGILDAAFADAYAGQTKYANFQGDPELRAEISKYYKDEYDMDIADNEIFVTASGNIAMFMVMKAILDPGDEVILVSPYYTPYPAQVESNGGKVVELLTFEEEDFQINMDRLKSVITPRTKAIVINTPGNPSGSCLSLETMQALAKVVEENDLLVVADDIYTSFSFQNKFIPFASLPGMKERTICINSFSKNFLMTGFRVGNVVASAEIIKVMGVINQCMMFCAPTISQRAAIYALQHRDEIQAPIIAEYKERMYYAAERANKIPWMSVLYPPKGSFYLFINIKKTGLTSVQAMMKILEDAHVLTLPGSEYGTSGEGFIRICCTVGIDTLKEVFDRFEKMEF